MSTADVASSSRKALSANVRQSGCQSGRVPIYCLMISPERVARAAMRSGAAYGANDGISRAHVGHVPVAQASWICKRSVSASSSVARPMEPPTNFLVSGSLKKICQHLPRWRFPTIYRGMEFIFRARRGFLLVRWQRIGFWLMVTSLLPILLPVPHLRRGYRLGYFFASLYSACVW